MEPGHTPRSDLSLQVERLLDVHRTREARLLLARHLAEHPRDVDALCWLGVAAHMEDARAEALECATQVLGLDPTHVGGRHLAFRLALAEGRYAQAEELIIGLLREQPRDPDFLANYGRLMLLTGHVGKARALTGEALRCDPEHADAKLVTALLDTCAGRHGAASERMSDLIKTRPNELVVVRVLILSLTQRGRFFEAERLARELVVAYPHDDELVELLVEIKLTTHPLGWPVLPLARFGVFGSAAAWFAFIVLAQILWRTARSWLLPVAVVYLLWVIYSWTYRPLLRRWLVARGF